MAKREKISLHKVVITKGKRNIIHEFLEEYNIQIANYKTSNFLPAQKVRVDLSDAELSIGTLPSVRKTLRYCS